MTNTDGIKRIGKMKNNFAIAEILADCACDLDCNVETKNYTSMLHDMAEYLAGDRVDEIYGKPEKSE